MRGTGSDCLDIVEALGVAVKSVRAYGAALLAPAGTGEYASVSEVCRAAIRETELVSAGTAAVAPCTRR
jgi:hypothetical protein